MSPELRADIDHAKKLEGQFVANGDRAALDEAVSVWERVLASLDFHQATSGTRLVGLNGAGGVYLRRHSAGGRLTDLDRALALLAEAVRTTPAEDRNLPGLLNNLGNGLRKRYAYTGRLEDLNEATEVSRRAVQATPIGSPSLPGRLNNLGTSLRRKYALTGRIEDLDEALDVSRRAVMETPADSPELPRHLTNFGNGLSLKYARDGEPEVLEAALDAHRRAVETTSKGSPDLPARLSNLGTSLSDQYARTGRPEDLEAAVETFRHAIKATLPESREMPRYMNNLGVGLRRRYMRTSLVEDLDAALDAFHRAVQGTPTESPELHARLNNLGNGLRWRYARTGRMDDLEAAIEVFRRAVQPTSGGSPDLPARLTNLGTGLSDRYVRTGRIEDLDAALDVYRRAAKLTPGNSTGLPAMLNNLGNGLRMRFARTGQIDDLEAALGVYRQAVEATPKGSPNLPWHLNNLGTGLSERYARTGRIDDLEAALDVFQRAIRAMPNDSMDLPACLNNLASGLSDRYARNGQVEDLEAAIECSQRAVLATPNDSPDLPARLNNLGTGLRMRYAHSGWVEVLESALDCFRRAVQFTQMDSPDLPARLNNLGTGLSDLYARSGRIEDLDSALDVYRRACVGGLDLNPEAAVMAARSWSSWAMRRGAWEETVQATTHGMAAADRLHRVQLLRADKESWIREARGLHLRAAYARARIGDLGGAVLAAELGRARLLTEVLDRDRADMEAARREDPAAVGRYEAAAALLQRTESSITWPASSGGMDPRPFRDQVREARAVLDESIAAIRLLPGNADFLAPPNFEELTLALEDEVPAVYITVTEVGSMALIVHRAGAETLIEPLWADGLTEGRLREMVFGREGNPPQRGWVGAWNRVRLERTAAAHMHWHELLSETTRQLWDLLIGPLVGRLHELGATEAVLIPSGLLGLLPLHAAWTDSPRPRAALDTVAFRYAPSLRTLEHAGRFAVGGTSDTFLMVCEPRPAEDLPFAAIEVKAVGSLFEGKVSLFHEQATRAAVLDALPGMGGAHFSCHGGIDWDDPLQSGLLMADNERLTVQDLFSVHLPGARMAVISACETGVPGTKLPDEVVGLPAAFLQAGFGGVVASLWSVNDLSTALLMIRFYELWRGDGLRPAVALQRAQLWMRDTTNAEKLAYFDKRIPQAASARLPGNGLAAALFHLEVVLADRQSQPSARDFAHPVWWAAFTLTGV